MLLSYFDRSRESADPLAPPGSRGEKRRKPRSVGAAKPRNSDEQSEIWDQRPGLPIIPAFRCAPARCGPPLENLEHLIDRPLGQPVADADADDVVEPAVLLGRRLERRDDAEIVVRGLDHLAPSDAVEHFLGAVADAGVGHADDRIVV